MSANLTEKIDSLNSSLPSLKELTDLIEELNSSDDDTLNYLFTSARLIT